MGLVVRKIGRPPLRCGLCRDRLGDRSETVRCPVCRTCYHEECVAEFGSACAIYGCGATFDGLEDPWRPLLLAQEELRVRRAEQRLRWDDVVNAAAVVVISVVIPVLMVVASHIFR